MTTLPEILENRLNAWSQRGLRREIRARSGLDFCSNDYLGFAENADLKQAALNRLREEEIPLGSSGSRLLRGALPIYEDTERDLARFSSRESALLFPSGYQANVALLGSLLQPGDLVLSDEKNHASLIDGIRLSGARKRIYPHLDTAALEALLIEERKSEERLRVIVTESVFSMDGDIARLEELAFLAKKHDALLIVDEAHATGLWERDGHGGGLVQCLNLKQNVFATIHAGGKALGASGAWIACDAGFRDYLVNFARPVLFSTAPSPLSTIALHEAVRFWRDRGAAALKALHEKVSLFRKEIGLPSSKTPIIPIILGSNERALRTATHLQGQGFDVRAIRPPTVHEGEARLRITIRSTTRGDDIKKLARLISGENA